jgi:hypothetical protein
MSGLLQSLERFMEAYHARHDLVAEQRGWSPTIALVASDTGAAARARVDDGRIVALDEGAAGDVVIRADEATLRDVLELRRSANEPYVFGELVVEGAEADFLRLDYITTVLGP